MAAKKSGGKKKGKGSDKSKGKSSAKRANPAAGALSAATPPEQPEQPEQKKYVAKKTAKDFIAEGVTDDVQSASMISPDGDIIGGGGKLNLPDQDGDKTLSRFEESLLAGITEGVEDKTNPFIESDGAAAGKASAGIGEEGGAMVDLAGDGGVMKEVLSDGSGPLPKKGAKVFVNYTGTLADSGKEFDSTKGKGEFSFTLGEGRVIKGWEVGVASMAVGESARFTLAAGYGYGRRGAPPVIGPNASLIFDVELLRVEVPEDVAKAENILSSRSFAEDNPTTARTPDDIANEYFSKLAQGKKGAADGADGQEKKAGGIKGFLDQFYFISPFASQTGERPPWYLNPNITFVVVFGLVGLAFYVVYVAGGVRLGYVGQDSVDVNIFNK